MWPTELPASVSLMPMQNRPSPLAAIGQPAVPQRVGAEVLDRARRAVEDQLGEDRGSTRRRGASSSSTIAASMSPRPAPPHRSPIVMPNSSALRMPSHGPLRELLGLVAVARHRRELALGDVAGELAQRGLVLGVGERVASVAPDHRAERSPHA